MKNLTPKYATFCKVNTSNDTGKGGISMGGGRRDIYASKLAVRIGSLLMFCTSPCVRTAIRQKASGNRSTESLEIHSANSTGIPHGRPQRRFYRFPEVGNAFTCCEMTYNEWFDVSKGRICNHGFKKNDPYFSPIFLWMEAEDISLTKLSPNHDTIHSINFSPSPSYFSNTNTARKKEKKKITIPAENACDLP